MTFSNNAKRMGLLFVALLMAALLLHGSAHAANTTFTLLGNDASGTSSFTNPATGAAARWTGPSDPTVAGGGNTNTYDVPGTSAAYLLRTPADNAAHAFPGDILQVDAGGRFLLKATTTTNAITVGSLTLNGGYIDKNLGTAGTQLFLTGNIALVSATSGVIGAGAGEMLTVSAPITGTGNLRLNVTGYAFGNASLSLTETGTVVLSANNGYSGTTLVGGGTAILSGANTTSGVYTVLPSGTGTTTAVLSLRNASALPAATNTGIVLNSGAGLNSILEIGATLASDGSDFNYTPVNENGTNPGATTTNQISFFGNVNNNAGGGFAAWGTGTGSANNRIVALGGIAAPTTLIKGGNLGGGGYDHLTFGSSTANGTLILKNPNNLNGAAGTYRGMQSIRGVGTVPEGRLDGVLSSSGGNPEVGYTGNGGIILNATNTITPNSCNIVGGVIYLGGNDAVLGNAVVAGTTNLGATSYAGLVADTTGTQNIGVLFYHPSSVGIGSSPTFTTNHPFTVVNVGTGTMTFGEATADYDAFNGAITLNKTAQLVAVAGSRVDFTGILSGGGGVSVGGNTVVEGDATTPGITLAGTGLVVFTNANAYTGTTTINSGGTLQIGNNGTAGALATTGSIVDNGTLLFNRTDSVVQGTNFSSAAITGTGGLTQSGSGTLTLNAANSYSGTTTISAGILNTATLANHNVASGIGAGSAGGSAADLVFGAGTLQYNSAAAVSTDRLFTIGSAVGNTATLDSSAASSANTVSFTGTGSIAYVNTASHSLTLTGSNTGNNAFAPINANQSIGNATSLTKSGVGTWALQGANTYTGATTISGGTLALDHSGTNTGQLGDTAVSVGANTLLIKGNASIGTVANKLGSVSVAAGGTLSLQDGAVNTLTINGTLAMTGPAAFSVELGGSSTDAIVVTGAAAVSGTITVNLPVVAGQSPTTGNYVILSVASGLNAATFSIGTQPPTGTFGLTKTDTTLTLNVVATATISGSAYWTGVASQANSDALNNWSNGGATATNWSINLSGTPDALMLPGSASKCPLGNNRSNITAFADRWYNSILREMRLSLFGFVSFPDH